MLVEVSFLLKVSFVLHGNHSPTFHEPILANEQATGQAAGLIRQDNQTFKRFLNKLPHKLLKFYYKIGRWETHMPR
jgi:hypothetical protein